VAIDRGQCFFLCLPWLTRRVVYDPPRNTTQ
jgi:hypothetical protein